MARCVWGIGGGSDFYTACSLARPSDIILTSLSPIVIDNGINLAETVSKYTGKPYQLQGKGPQSAKKSYTCYSKHISPDLCMILNDARRPKSYGVVIPPQEFPEAFERCCSEVLQLLNGCTILAVDTGGDSLRGIVPNMGDNDISGLFGNTRDTRDSDSLRVIRIITKSCVDLIICGPGADGETKGESLDVAWKSLSLRRLTETYELVDEGSMLQLSQDIKGASGWKDPAPGSTISNIVRALESDDDFTVIYRLGREVCKVRTILLRSFWRIRIL